MPAPDGTKRLVRPLHDSLGADVYPRAGRHLPVHHQAFALKLAEMLPRRPAADEIAVGDEHAWRGRVGAKNANRLSALHQQSLVGAKVPQLAHDGIEAVPVAGSLSRSAVDDEILRTLRHIRIEVVHQHPQRRFLLPSLARDGAAARRANWSALPRRRLEGFWIVLHSEIRHVTVPISAKRPSATAVINAAISVLRTRSLSSFGTMSRTRSCAVRTPLPGRSGARKSMA